MERLTEEHWRNLDPWECCGQDYYCKRDCHEKGGCINGCIVPRVYCRLAAYEDTGFEPEEITTKRPSCVFYCNRQCNLNGDWCAEGPGCPFELDGAKAGRFLLQITQPNTPLTLEELWEMGGEPVWNDTMKKWYFVVLHWEHGPVAVDYEGNWRPLDDRYYRRKPEEGYRGHG